MRYIGWLMRGVIFLALLMFAIKNNQPVSLHYFFAAEWQTSLVSVLLIFFLLGVVMGIVAMLGRVLQQRRQISQLKQQLEYKNNQLEKYLFSSDDSHDI